MPLQFPISEPRVNPGSVVPGPSGEYDFAGSFLKGYQASRVLAGIPQQQDQLSLDIQRQRLNQEAQSFPIELTKGILGNKKDEFALAHADQDRQLDVANKLTDIYGTPGVYSEQPTAVGPTGPQQVPQDLVNVNIPEVGNVWLSPNEIQKFQKDKINLWLTKLLTQDQLVRGRADYTEQLRQNRPGAMWMTNPQGQLEYVKVPPGGTAPAGYSRPQDVTVYDDPITGTPYIINKALRKAFTVDNAGGTVEVGMDQVPQEAFEGEEGDVGQPQRGDKFSVGGKKSITEGAIDDVNATFSTLGLLRQMGPFIQQGKGGLEGASSWVGAMTGSDPASVDFEAADTQMRLAGQALIKGIPSDRDAQLLTNTLPGFLKADARNKARFDIALKIAKNNLLNRIAFYKGTGVRIPDYIFNKAKGYGIDVGSIDGVAGWEDGQEPFKLSDAERQAFISGKSLPPERKKQTSGSGPKGDPDYEVQIKGLGPVKVWFHD